MEVKEFRIAAIDLGTVSSRLALATVRDGVIVSLDKRTVITDLGEGVDATGRFCDAAVARVMEACRGFVALAHDFAPAATCTTLTSAARDASNGEELLAGLRSLGLHPQVIPGEVEARLTFFGVAHDFPAQRIAVADSGGGSTELATGLFMPGDPLTLERVESLNIGCRRVTERYLTPAPPSADQLAEAASFAAQEFAPYWDGLAALGEGRPERLVAVGGTVTTLVAMVNNLTTYDARFVHLHELSASEVEGAIERMRGLSAEQIAQLPGIQPKRAPVILAGAVVIRELLRASGFNALTVSENSLLAGMAATMYEALAGREPTIGWQPDLS